MSELERPLHGKCVLIIEDNLVLLKTLAERFAAAGAAVTVASEGAAGMRQFRKQRPDLVITDIIMPDKEGIETICEIRVLAPELPVLAISGGGRIQAGAFLDLARRLGATDVMAKPFRSQEILNRAIRLLDSEACRS
ncbi:MULTISPECIES: response regulator [unclassified Brevundimonas]|uniref:response regulator n=1 Tax=unclassified Brevundimonas TaxID=2622653 RepID=UPI003F9031F3